MFLPTFPTFLPKVAQINQSMIVEKFRDFLSNFEMTAKLELEIMEIILGLHFENIFEILT